MTAADLLWALPGLLASVLVGRLLLDLLPGGIPGGRGPFEPAGSLAMALVVGLATLGLQCWLAEQLLGARPGAPGLLLPWVVAGALRSRLGPGPVAPRTPRGSAPVGPAERPLVRLLRVGTVAAVAWLAIGLEPGTAGNVARLPQQATPLPLLLTFEWPLWLVGGERPGFALPPLMLLAAACITGTGLAIARRAAWSRAAWVFLLTFPPTSPGLAELTLEPRRGILAAPAIAMAAAGGVSWMRLADRRGRAVSILGLVLVSLLEPQLLGCSLAGLLALTLLCARPGRRSTALLSGAGTGLALLAAGGVVGRGSLQLEPGELLHSWSAWGVALLAALGLRLRRVLQPGRGQHGARGLFSAEEGFLGSWLLASALVAPWISGARPGALDPAQAPELMLPVVAMLAGLLLLPAEHLAEGELRA